MIYLDHNATTRIKPAVVETVARTMGMVGNASSVHGAGRQARAVVEHARTQLARLCNADPKGVVFTSGATEANNTVLKHFAGHSILASAVEHPSVLEAAAHGVIPVHKNGTLDMDAYATLLLQKPALVSVMLANNETGIIQPIKTLAEMAHDAGAKFHCDAVQAAGKIPLDMQALGVDYLTLSAHKMGGPQGVGALVTKAGAPPVKLLYGGGQERRARAGTENVAGIAGFGHAAELALESMETYTQLAHLRNRIESGITGITVFGQEAPRLPNTTCFALPGVASDTQLMALDLAGICVSNGSACASGTVKPSHVLAAMGLDHSHTASALRVSLGWDTTATDVETFISTYTRLQKQWQK